MSEGVESANTLPSYITAYHKRKSIDDLTLNHIMFLEDTQQFPHDISAVISDDIEKFFDRITTETQIFAMYHHAVHVMGTLNGLPRQGPIHGTLRYEAFAHYYHSPLWIKARVVVLLSLFQLCFLFQVEGILSSTTTVPPTPC